MIPRGSRHRIGLATEELLGESRTRCPKMCAESGGATSPAPLGSSSDDFLF
jgi:hypothetical protein